MMRFQPRLVCFIFQLPILLAMLSPLRCSKAVTQLHSKLAKIVNNFSEIERRILSKQCNCSKQR